MHPFLERGRPGSAPTPSRKRGSEGAPAPRTPPAHLSRSRTSTPGVGPSSLTISLTPSRSKGASGGRATPDAPTADLRGRSGGLAGRLGECRPRRPRPRRPADRQHRRGRETPAGVAGDGPRQPRPAPRPEMPRRLGCTSSSTGSDPTRSRSSGSSTADATSTHCSEPRHGTLCGLQRSPSAGPSPHAAKERLVDL